MAPKLARITSTQSENVSESFAKAKWNDSNTETFLKVCVEEVEAEFNMWAMLVEKETGLGWDSVKNTIIAPLEWWAAKGKENPKYLNWKEEGPKFLSLMEICFKDVVATGYVVFMLRECILSPEEAIDDEPINDNDHALEDEGVGEGDIEEHPSDHNQRPSVRNNYPRKRKRGRKGEKRQGIADKLQHSLD
ncbi:hypothetical protein K1719_003294 [Acacia pycnantha]|nr:hypothetical protein K1719_003294 [Acacia pycnantha]